MKDLKWFLERIGKKVKAYSNYYGYYSYPTIENRNRAKYLYGWYQNYKNWIFDDL